MSADGAIREVALKEDAPRASVRGRRLSRAQMVSVIQRSATMIVLALTMAGGSLAFGDSFLNFGNLHNIAASASFLAIICVAMTFVIISGGIDLSVGSMLALAAVLTAYGSRWGSVGAILLPLTVCGGIGLFHGVMIARAKLAPFIVTLSGLLFARGLAFAVSDEGNVTHLVEPGLNVSFLGRGEVFEIGMPIIMMAITFGVGMVILNRTGYGQALYAIGGAEEAAQLMGLRVGRAKIITYSTSGLLAAVAGILVAARSGSGLSTIGVGLELEAIAAVVIGGTLLTGGAGTLAGTLAGVLLLQVIRNLINQVGTLSSYWQAVVSGTFLIIVVIVQRSISRRQQA